MSSTIFSARARRETLEAFMKMRKKTGFSSSEKWCAAVDQSLESLSTMAQKASKEVLNATGRYDALLRLHRTLQLLIRLRDALEGGLRRIEFGLLGLL